MCARVRAYVRTYVYMCGMSDVLLVGSPFFLPDPACATHATVPFPKTLRCPCSSEDKVSVTWCLTCPLGGSSVCLNSTSVTSVFGDCHRSYASGQLYISQYPGYISFRNDTSLYLSRVDLTYQYTTFNCTCQCLNGSKCGAKNNFSLTFDSKSARP